MAQQHFFGPHTYFTVLDHGDNSPSYTRLSDNLRVPNPVTDEDFGRALDVTLGESASRRAVWDEPHPRRDYYRYCTVDGRVYCIYSKWWTGYEPHFPLRDLREA